jgi:hypothetical protein
MNIDKIRSKAIGSIWQAIAQSNIDLQSISKEDQESLVSRIADSVLLSFDGILEEEFKGGMEDEKSFVEDEKLIWKGRPFLSMVESYAITTERVKVNTGLVSRHVENFELIRIQDIDFKQNVGERLFGLGDITIKGHDPSDPEIVLRNLPKPEDIYEILRKAWLEARQRYGLQFREYM